MCSIMLSDTIQIRLQSDWSSWHCYCTSIIDKQTPHIHRIVMDAMDVRPSLEDRRYQTLTMMILTSAMVLLSSALMENFSPFRVFTVSCMMCAMVRVSIYTIVLLLKCVSGVGWRLADGGWMLCCCCGFAFGCLWPWRVSLFEVCFFCLLRQSSALFLDLMEW